MLATNYASRGKERYKEAYNLTELNNKQQQTILQNGSLQWAITFALAEYGWHKH
jgi:hypothetical protein